MERIDPVTKLGLCIDSIWSYHVEDIVRYISNAKDYKPPEKSPFECMSNGSNISICLKGAMHSGSLDALAFDTLIPKSILQRYKFNLIFFYRNRNVVIYKYFINIAFLSS